MRTLPSIQDAGLLPSRNRVSRSESLTSRRPGAYPLVRFFRYVP